MKILENLKSIARIRSGKDQQRGFTLIELVIVLAILGVLAAIGIPQLTGLQSEAERAGEATNIASEISNGFARDLAAGIPVDGTGDTATSTGEKTSVDWNASDMCTEVLGNAAASDTLEASDYSLTSTDPEDGSPSISVPTYDENGIGDSETCYLDEA